MDLKEHSVARNTIKKLSNQKFVNNAPKNVIDIEQKKYDDTITKIKSFKKQLNSFDESK